TQHPGRDVTGLNMQGLQYIQEMTQMPNETTATETLLFDNSYHKETLEFNWNHERNKTRDALWTIGGLLLASDLLRLLLTGTLTPLTLMWTLLVPALYVGLGLMARSAPMVSITMGMVLFVAIIG